MENQIKSFFSELKNLCNKYNVAGGFTGISLTFVSRDTFEKKEAILTDYVGSLNSNDKLIDSFEIEIVKSDRTWV